MSSLTLSRFPARALFSRSRWLAGASTCASCEAGKYYPYTGATAASSCYGSACAAGKYGQEAAASSSAATCTLCLAGNYSSAGASRVCLLRCPLFPARHNVQTDIPYSTCMHAGVLSRANGPLTAVLRPVCRRLCNHCYCTRSTHDADRGDGGHNTHAHPLTHANTLTECHVTWVTCVRVCRACECLQVPCSCRDLI